MLSSQKSGWDDDRYLLARQHGHQARPECYLRLSETNVTAHETVHWPSACQVVQHRVDAGHLIFCFLVGEPGGELFISAIGRRQRWCRPQLPQRSDFDELFSHVSNALFQLRLARLPRDAAELVENDTGFIRTVACQKLDVLYR